MLLDQARVHQVALVDIDLKTKALSDGFGQHLSGIALQICNLLEQRRDLRLMLTVLSVFHAPGTRDGWLLCNR